MRSLNRALVLLFVIELSAGAVLCWNRLQRYEPPLPDFGKVDDETKEALMSLREKARDGSGGQWRNLAEGFLGTGYYAAAEQCFFRAHELAPDDQRSLYGFGFCLERTGSTSKAITALTEIAESPRTDAELSWTCWYQIGRCYLREEKPDEAEKAFRKIPEFAPAVYQLCKLLTRTGRAEEAIPLLEEQLELYPNDVKFLQLRGKAAAATGDTATAAEMRDREDRAQYVVEMEYGLKFIGSMSSKYGLGYRLSRALTLKEEGTPQEQAAALSSALTMIRKHRFWNYRSVFVAMAELLVETGQAEKAKSVIEEVRRFSQDGPELMLLEARALLSEGRRADAEVALRRAERLKPGLEITELLLVVTEDKEAQAKLQADRIFRLGLAEFSTNNVAESAPYFEKAIELDPQSAKYNYYLAEAFRLTEMKNEARTAYQKCLELCPEHGRAAVHRQLLSD